MLGDHLFCVLVETVGFVSFCVQCEEHWVEAKRSPALPCAVMPFTHGTRGILAARHKLKAVSCFYWRLFVSGVVVLAVRDVLGLVERSGGPCKGSVFKGCAALLRCGEVGRKWRERHSEKCCIYIVVLLLEPV